MKQIINILIIFAVYAVIAVSANFKPFTLEHLNETDSLRTVINKTNRNNDKQVRKDREGQKWDNDHYPQYGYAGNFSWNSLGGWYECIVYLPEKYETDTSYVVTIGRQAPDIDVPANQIVLRYTDSSFAVRSDTTGNGVMWQTMGVRKTTE